MARGGFYKHFARKEDLYHEAVLEFICQEQPEAWQRRHVDPSQSGPALARMILDAYLSDDHFADRDASCPMIALPSDVQRGQPAVKDAFRQVLEMMTGAFAANLEPSSRPARQRALALVSMAVGAMVLARSVGDPRGSGREIRDGKVRATRPMRGRAGVWPKPSPTPLNDLIFSTSSTRTKREHRSASCLGLYPRLPGTAVGGRAGKSQRFLRQGVRLDLCRLWRDLLPKFVGAGLLFGVNADGLITARRQSP